MQTESDSGVVGRAAPLPPFYYVEHFAAALRCLEARDRDLLDARQAAFIRDFAALPLPQRALTVRLALRQGPYYRGVSLRYADLADPPAHLEALQKAGWVTGDPVVEVGHLITLLPVTWLAEGFGLRPSPALNKARMVMQAREMYPDPLPLSHTHFRLRDGLYQFLHADTCRSLCALYFGNHHQDWTEYAVADLGIRRYECVKLDGPSQPFTSRAEVELFEALHACLVQLEAGTALQSLALLPASCPSCDWLVERHRDVSLRIARQLEREGEPGAALDLYQRVGSPEAEQRGQIVARRLGVRVVPQPRFRHRSVPHFEVRLSGVAQGRIEYRLAAELGRQDPDSEIIYAENRLINSLFGLLFWQVIFMPVRGAFFHPFHAAPADLYSPRFVHRRQAAIETTLAALDGGQYRDIIRDNFRAKRGLINPFVAWGWLRRPVLERALECLPAADLRLLCDWMLADLERNTAGFPDLMQLWPAEQRYRLVEVKLGADRLQPNQQRFLRYAQEHGLPVSVCYVSQGVPLPKSPRRATARRRAGLSLELFPGEPLGA